MEKYWKFSGKIRNFPDNFSASHHYRWGSLQCWSSHLAVFEGSLCSGTGKGGKERVGEGRG